jgi:hypothetical protein
MATAHPSVTRCARGISSRRRSAQASRHGERRLREARRDRSGGAQETCPNDREKHSSCGSGARIADSPRVMKTNDFRRWVKPRHTYQRLSRQSVECPVVSERVTATLRFRPALSDSRFFVECDQRECQYCEVNAPPCPLNTEMFSRVIAARRAESVRDDEGDGRTMSGPTGASL